MIIGGLQFSGIPDCGRSLSDYRTFFDAPAPAAANQIRVQWFSNPIPEELEIARRNHRFLIDTGTTWSLSVSSESDCCFHFGPPPYQNDETSWPPIPYVLANQDFSSLRVYAPRHPEGLRLFPLDEILISHILSLRQGFIVHASGVKNGDEGYLFLGDSGAGKSTISELFERALPHCEVFSDDRIILRFQNGRWWMHGTPWHGTLPRVSCNSVPLKALCFLEKSPTHQAIPLSPTQTIQKLLPVSLGTPWIAESVPRFILQLEKLSRSQSIQFLKLGFAPDPSIAEFVLRETNKRASRVFEPLVSTP